MPMLEANSLLSDPAPIWFDEPAALDALAAAPIDPLQAALAMLEAQAQQPVLAEVPAPAADPLAQALPWLVRHLGVAAAVEAAVGPVDDERPAASDDVLPALRRIGFDAHLQRRSLASFSQADLPTVLMLHSGDACVLTARWQDAQGQAQCNLVLPGPQPEEFSSAEAEIEAEYSGVALVVSRPARPPLASALARARAASAGLAGAGPLAAGQGAAADAPPIAPARARADAPTGTHADALVALAAAMGGAQRAMHATRAQAAPLRPAQATAPAQPLPRRAAPALAAQAPAGLQGDDPASVLNLSFLQSDKAVLTPGQALARMARDARALVRGTLAPLSRLAVAGLRALRRHTRAAGRQLAGLAKTVKAGLMRLARQGAQGRARRAWRRLGLAAFQLRQHKLAWHQRWRQRQLNRQALAALGPVLRSQSPPASPSGAALAPIGPGRPGPASVAQRLADAAAGLRRAWLPGLAGASALCLLVGAPQAWAAMVSSTSLQALQATPQLLRGAFTANLEQAGQALAAQGQARRVATQNRLDGELGPRLLTPAAAPAVRGRGLPRRARHIHR